MFTHSLPRRIGSSIVFFSFLIAAIPVYGVSPENCRFFANGAIDQYHRARHLGIPNLSHDVWSPSYSRHYNWCTKSAKALVHSGDQQRENVIQDFCIKNHGFYGLNNRLDKGDEDNKVPSQCILTGWPSQPPLFQMQAPPPHTTGSAQHHINPRWLAGNFSSSAWFPLYAACSTGNSWPVSYCTDWLTGPASSENDQLQMFYGDRTKKPWAQGVLTETDVGRPVMSPDGKQLELVVFGDSFVANPKFTLEDHRKAVIQCMNMPLNTVCTKFASGDPNMYKQCFNNIPKANACTYIFAPIRRLPVFDHLNNVTIFDAEIDSSLTYRIKFKKHLYNKMVRHGAQEGVDAFSHSYFTGVYGLDYFYTCPGSATTCEDADKLLNLITQTVFWNPTSGKPTTEQMDYTKLSREGIGFYQFGPLNATKKTSEGCRLRYGPSYAKPPIVADFSCTGSTTQWLQPKHTHTTKNYTVDQPDNVHVYWGSGTKFTFAIVAHGYTDPYHTGSPASSNYIYFIGSGETNSQNKATGKIYLVRLPASENSLINAQFEYFKGKNKNGASEWGAYQEAKSILDTPIFYNKPPLASSFTKRFGKYYLAATCYYKSWPWNPAYGMCVVSSKNGLTWQDFDFALYSDIVLEGGLPVSPSNVYGHMWVPELLYPDTDEIAYIFSVWKSPKGYFKDVFRIGGHESLIKAEHLFYNYNTKMFLYRPKGQKY